MISAAARKRRIASSPELSAPRAAPGDACAAAAWANGASPTPTPIPAAAPRDRNERRLTPAAGGSSAVVLPSKLGTWGERFMLCLSLGGGRVKAASPNDPAVGR